MSPFKPLVVVQFPLLFALATCASTEPTEEPAQRALMANRDGHPSDASRLSGQKPSRPNAKPQPAAADAEVDEPQRPEKEAGAAPPTPDDSVDAGGCSGRRQVFEDFLATHQSCTRDSDCTLIGDCGPNADFRAIRVDAAVEGSRLHARSCNAAWDGEIPDVGCVSGTCQTLDTTQGCCGCIPVEAGPSDGGSP